MAMKKDLGAASTLTYEKNINTRVGCDWNQCRGLIGPGRRFLSGSHTGPPLPAVAGLAEASNIGAPAGFRWGLRT